MAAILLIHATDLGAVSVDLDAIARSLSELGHTLVRVTGSSLASTSPPIAAEVVLLDLTGVTTSIAMAQVTQIAQAQGLPMVYLWGADEPSAALRPAAIATAPYACLSHPVHPLDLHDTVQLAIHRDRTRQQLQTTQQWLSTGLDSLGQGLIVCDREGRVIYMNAIAEMLSGLTQSQCLGEAIDPLLQFVLPGRAEPMANPLLEAMRSRQTQSLPDYCLLRTDGKMRCFVGDMAAPIQTPTGEVLGGILVFQDTTSQVQSQREMEQQQHSLRLQQVVMTQLSKCQDVYEGNLTAALEQITATAAHTLSVQQVSVWFLADQDTVLYQEKQYDLGDRRYSFGKRYICAEHPAYLAAIADSYKIAISDARTDPRTASLYRAAIADSYPIALSDVRPDVRPDARTMPPLILAPPILIRHQGRAPISIPCCTSRFGFAVAPSGCCVSPTRVFPDRGPWKNKTLRGIWLT